MQNNPSTTGNPSLPLDAEAARKTKESLADDKVEKTEAEKEEESRPEDKEPFNLDKVDELNKSKNDHTKE